MSHEAEEKPSKEFNSVASIALTEVEKPALDDPESRELDIEKQEPTETLEEKQDGLTEVNNNIVDWDGENDPENPRNWSRGKKLLNVGIISASSLTSPLASSMVAPGVKALMAEFHSDSRLLSSFTVSCYILGFAFGPLVLAPLSELYGRRKVYLLSWLMSFGFTLGCAKAPSLGAFIVFRVLAGCGGVVAQVNGGGTIVDVYDVHQRGAAMSIFAMGPLLGPVIGPIGGGFLAEAKGWRWVFWFLTILFGVSTVVGVLFLRETYAPTLLANKTKRLIKETGNQNLESKLAIKKTPKDIFWTAIRRPMTMLFHDPIVAILSVYIAIIFAFLYLLFATFPTVFAEQYHFNTGIQGLAYIGMGVGNLSGAVLTAFTSDRISIALAKKHGGPKAEFRLITVMMTCWACPVGLFWYGWAAEAKVHWIVPIMGTALFGLGLFGTMMPVQTYLIDSYKRYAASALAASTLLRSLLGALLPLAGQNLYIKLGYGWGNSLLGFIGVAMLPFPFLFYRYGEAIRNKFKREY
ncbi:MFS general substrate transporter [Mytilinidion resinicola]|uniref:MFS general substrate transporter n=1 Tax=Mytilinidion resinicola TaxID=574789 RepID=A0A6A6YJF7_9PEZI|nr:MFS general substrate transporter [Mytilinidion resinicola]KAF2808124.1 MFS general substrate transporter [Mytilinidion resinicola]